MIGHMHAHSPTSEEGKLFSLSPLLAGGHGGTGVQFLAFHYIYLVLFSQPNLGGGVWQDIFEDGVKL